MCDANWDVICQGASKQTTSGKRQTANDETLQMQWENAKRSQKDNCDSIHPTVCLSVCLSVPLSIRLSARPPRDELLSVVNNVINTARRQMEIKWW